MIDGAEAFGSESGPQLEVRGRSLRVALYASGSASALPHAILRLDLADGIHDEDLD